jgi:hypothetical protein
MRPAFWVAASGPNSYDHPDDELREALGQRGEFVHVDHRADRAFREEFVWAKDSRFGRVGQLVVAPGMEVDAATRVATWKGSVKEPLRILLNHHITIFDHRHLIVGQLPSGDTQNRPVVDT